MTDHQAQSRGDLIGPALTSMFLDPMIKDGFAITVGRYTYGKPKVMWSKGDFAHTLKIGAFCSIAEDVVVFVGTHGRHTVDWISTFPMGLVYGRAENTGASRAISGNLSVNIGNDVWIGRRCLIMAGVTIGDGAVIAAGAVVNKDVAPYSIVGGVPIKVLRQRFPERIVEKLRKLKWWDWSDEVIVERRDMFATADFEREIDRYLNI